VVKTTVFLQHISDFAAMNEIYAAYFQTEAPARSAVEMAALPKGGLVEIEAVALLK
jgi:2-iminobutanoate/2-iminopropanoate deaminase